MEITGKEKTPLEKMEKMEKTSKKMENNVIWNNYVL